MDRKRIIIFIFIFGLFLPLSYVSAGTILSTNKYAWSNNVGYINFENVVVSDGSISGYAWSANNGWIKFNPALGGVANDGNGNLSGSAWGDSLGWIDFDNVSINPSTGKFSGTATGQLVGTINFDCSNYCDVRTDWRKAAVSNTSGSISSIPNMNLLPPVNARNIPLIVNTNQPGVLVQDTDAGEVKIEIPSMVTNDQATFFVVEEPLENANNYLLLDDIALINNAFYNVYAKDKNGNLIHFFAKPITISLPIPENLLYTENLAVYWLNEENWQWVLIPDAVFSGNKVTFQVNHLTKFAIFSSKKEILNLKNKPISSINLPLDKKQKYQERQKDLLKKDNFFFYMGKKIKANLGFFVIMLSVLIILLAKKNRKKYY